MITKKESKSNPYKTENKRLKNSKVKANKGKQIFRKKRKKERN